MSQIKIRKYENKQGTPLLDQLSSRKSYISFYVLPSLVKQANGSPVTLFYKHLQTEGEQNPLALAQAISDIHKVREIRWNRISNKFTASVSYNCDPDHSNLEIDYIGVAHSRKEAAERLREGMILRKEKIAILVIRTSREGMDTSGLIDEVAQLRMVGSFNDQKYLERHILSIDRSCSIVFAECKLITFSFKYRSTYEQELQTYAAVDDVIDRLHLREMSTYEKIKTVYSYISKNLKYDYGYTNYSAYHAMIDKCATCQGYSLLFYLFMRKLQVPVEYISGIIDDGGHHGWNLVKYGSCWYNLDTTWEHTRKMKDISITYSKYFLKCDSDIIGRKRNDYYLTPEFTKQHPMATKSIT